MKELRAHTDLVKAIIKEGLPPNVCPGEIGEQVKVVEVPDMPEGSYVVFNEGCILTIGTVPLSMIRECLREEKGQEDD